MVRFPWKRRTLIAWANLSLSRRFLLSGDRCVLFDFNSIHVPFRKMILKCLLHYNVYSNNFTIVRYNNVCNHTERVLHFPIETCRRPAAKFHIFISNYCTVVGIHIGMSLFVFYFSWNLTKILNRQFCKVIFFTGLAVSKFGRNKSDRSRVCSVTRRSEASQCAGNVI